MRADNFDIAAVDPVLVLTVDPATTLRCVGTLDTHDQQNLVAVVDEMLRARPGNITVDIEQLQLADAEAANTLAQVQRMVKDSGAALHWHGVRADHLRSAPSLDYPAGGALASRIRRPKASRMRTSSVLVQGSAICAAVPSVAASPARG
ncbi:MAG: STAS domain-containing protein [Acidimicrobiales bacterium]|jgi:ABC-type transporter Mla MlaB component